MLDNFTEIPVSFLEGFSEEAATALRGEHEALRLALQASILRESRDMAAALDLLTEAQRAAPENPVVNNELVDLLMAAGEAALASGQMQEATRLYQRVLQHNPKEFWALFKLVALAMNAGDVGLAAQVLNQGLSFYPDSPVWIALRGKYRASTGDAAGGLADAQTAVAAAPRNPGVWNDYALVAQRAGDARAVQRAQEAIARLEHEW
jgi:tetratricopeptide (TPR) repeat protein